MAESEGGSVTIAFASWPGEELQFIGQEAEGCVDEWKSKRSKFDEALLWLADSNVKL